MKITYLGPEGTYSEEAAFVYGGPNMVGIPVATISEALEQVALGNADMAIVAVENSTEGSVGPTLDLFVEEPLFAGAEVLLPIHHQLLSKAKSLKEIKKITAHPQALAQCRKWLDEHLPGVQRVVSASNAQAAAEASSDNTVAAIAGKRAGDVYGLTVLGSNIEDIAGNATRFLVLKEQMEKPTGNDKTSLVCSAPHSPGSLYLILGIFAKYNVNITKLESRPTPDSSWDYIFFIDIEGHAEDDMVKAALNEAGSVTTFMKVIGSYPRA